MTNVSTLREANQVLARRVQDVDEGESYLITRNGRPAAKLTPTTAGPHRRRSPAQDVALTRTRARLETGWPIEAGALDTDALHAAGAVYG